MAQDGRDANGVAVNVGDTVKLFGTVAAVNLIDPHFNDVTITLANPVSAANDQGPRKDGHPEMDFAVPGSVKTINVHSSMLQH